MQSAIQSCTGSSGPTGGGKTPDLGSVAAPGFSKVLDDALRSGDASTIRDAVRATFFAGLTSSGSDGDHDSPFGSISRFASQLQSLVEDLQSEQAGTNPATSDPALPPGPAADADDASRRAGCACNDEKNLTPAGNAGDPRTVPQIRATSRHRRAAAPGRSAAPPRAVAPAGVSGRAALTVRVRATANLPAHEVPDCGGPPVPEDEATTPAKPQAARFPAPRPPRSSRHRRTPEQLGRSAAPAQPPANGLLHALAMSSESIRVSIQIRTQQMTQSVKPEVKTPAAGSAEPPVTSVAQPPRTFYTGEGSRSAPYLKMK